MAAAARRAVRSHLAPVPRLAVGAWLARQRRAAAIDVSDGLGLDLARLCEASGVGARVEPAALPLDPDLPRLAAALGTGERELALGGGEDYALLFALPAKSAPPPELGCRRIGEITTRRRRVLVEDGKESPLPASGWDHLRAIES
jgi:thiamine-monophosphate kinase